MKLYRQHRNWRRPDGVAYVEQPFTVVPWCAEHDNMIAPPLPNACFYGIRDGDYGNCRLEDPPRHIVLEG